jgi:hypothetical protein
METVMSFAGEWWMVGVGIVGAVAVAVMLWRWALEDLVLSAVELPTCERDASTPRPLPQSDPTLVG